MFLMRVIKHSEVEAQYTKEQLNKFYNKVKREIANICFEYPNDYHSIEEYYYIDDKNLPIPQELYDKIYEEEYKKWEASVVRVLDYSLIEDLI